MLSSAASGLGLLEVERAAGLELDASVSALIHSP